MSDHQDQLQQQLRADLVEFTRKRLGAEGSIHGLKASHILFGNYMAESGKPGIADFRDFFKHVPEKKKSVRTQFITFEQLVALIVQSFDGEGIDNSTWQIPVSAFTTDQQLSTLESTIKHYGITAVPGGFRGLSVMLFGMIAIQAKGLQVKLSPNHWQAWPEAFLVWMFLFYEALGLGGTSAKVLAFYRHAKEVATRGCLKDNEDYRVDSLYEEWKHLIEGAIADTCLRRDVFDCFYLGFVLGELYTLMERGKLNQEQHPALVSLNFDHLNADDLQQLAAVCGFMRRAAQGRGLTIDLSDEADLDDESDPQGLLNYFDEEFIEGDHLILEIAREMRKVYLTFSEARSNAISDLLQEDM